MSTSSSAMMMQGDRGQEEEGSLVQFGGHLFPGLRFQPTDVEILDFYLRNRLTSSSSATVSSCLIREFDVYSTEPWNLQGDSFRYQNLEQAMHFFTPRHATSSRSRRASRTAGCGVWHCNGRDNLINVGSRLIGHKTQLTFMILKGKDNEKKKTDWIMHEFRLQSPNNAKDFDGMVLCKIYKKRSNNCFREGEEEEATQRLAKRKRVEHHGLVSGNNEAGTCGIVYSESFGEYSSSLSDIPQLVSGEEPEDLCPPLASYNGEDGEEEGEKQGLVKRKCVEEHGCLMAENNEAGTCGIVYSESSSQHSPLLYASSSVLSDTFQLVSMEEPEGLSTLMASDTAYSQPFGEFTSLLFADSVENSDFLSTSSSLLSDMPQFVRREELEGLSTPLASDNVAASVATAIGEQGEEEAEVARERRVTRRLPEELAVMTRTSGVVYPEPSTQDTLLSSSSSTSLPDIFSSVLWDEPEGLAPLTVDDFNFDILSSSDDLPQVTLDDFDVDSMFLPDELLKLAEGPEYSVVED